MGHVSTRDADHGVLFCRLRFSLRTPSLLIGGVTSLSLYLSLLLSLCLPSFLVNPHSDSFFFLQ